MNFLFGKKQKQQVASNKPDPAQAIANLGQRISDIEEKISFLEVKKRSNLEIAKEKLKSGDKSGAKQALARKKKFDEQIKQYDGAILMMEEQKMMLENSASMRDVFTTLNTANKVLIDAQQGMSVEQLDNIRDDLEVMC
jgi:charged multivesicular body protein 4